MTKTDDSELKLKAAAALKEALEEHVALMQTAITESRGHGRARDKYIRALVDTGADRRLEWAVRAEMTGEMRPPPPTAEEKRRYAEEMTRWARANGMRNPGDKPLAQPMPPWQQKKLHAQGEK